MNIGTNYSALMSAIQKEWKDKTTNFIKVVLQIIRYFDFIEQNKKTHNIIQIFSSTIPTNCAVKGSCTNPKYVEKGLITHNIDY